MRSPLPQRAEYTRAAWAAPLSGGLTALVAVVALYWRPVTWRVEADVWVAENLLTFRLANPLAELPSPTAAVRGLDERLLSEERLVALAKGGGLIDQFESLRTPLERLQDRWAPKTDQAKLEAVVQLLRERVHVTLIDQRVHLVVDWPEAHGAEQLAINQFETLISGVASLERSAGEDEVAATDRRLAEVHRENAERLARFSTEARRARQEHRASALGNVDELREGLSREAELRERDRDQHVALDVLRRGNADRYLVLRRPELPRTPLSAPPVQLALLFVLFIGLSALAAPLIVARWGPPRLARVLMLGLAALSGVFLGLADGDWTTAIIPLGWAITVWLVLISPLKWPLLLLFFAAITCDDPTDGAYVGHWQSPVYYFGQKLFTNIAYFTGFEVGLLGLGGVMVARQLLGVTLDPGLASTPRPLRQALMLSLVTVGFLVLLGLMRGGEFRQALWQFRFLAMTPLVALLALHAFDFPDDLGALLAVLLGGSLLKAGFGIYFMQAVAPTLAHFPAHTTGHNDTMMLVIAVVTPLVLLWERPTPARLLLALLWLPAIALAIRYNDRRIAYVDVLACAAAVFLVSPRHRMKRAVLRGLAVMAPLFLLYLAVGWNHTEGRAFELAQTVRSLVAPVEGSHHESSNVERDIENFDLIASWRANPIFGQGFGHAFTEYVPLNDFSQSNFGHVGHNSLLWLLWIGGLVGFTGVLLYVGVSAFFLGRTLPRTRAPDERAAILVALCVLVVFLNQAFGDMGTQSIALALFVSLAVAIIGRLTVKQRAW